MHFPEEEINAWVHVGFAGLGVGLYVPKALFFFETLQTVPYFLLRTVCPDWEDPFPG